MVKEEKKSSFMEDALKDLEKIESGNVIEGTVIRAKNNEVWVDLGGRATGVVYKRELSDGFSTDLSEGDKVLTYVLNEEDSEGFVTLSLRKAGRERIWTELKRKQEKGSVVKVKISDANKGGLITMIEGVQGFIPVSQLTAEYYPRVDGGDKEEIFSRLSSIIGKDLDVKVIDVNRDENKLIFSQKAAKSEEQKKFIDGLGVGQNIKGRVTGVVDFGVFVNIGNMEGLVHISEVSWERVDDIGKLIKVGEELEVAIVDIENEKVSLSIKRLLPDPFKEAIKSFKEGDIVNGKVIKVTPFGAFVQVEAPDKKVIDGLVHISELSEDHVSNPKDIIKEGENYNLKVISIEEESRKLALSLKDAPQEKKVKPKKEKTEKKKKEDIKE